MANKIIYGIIISLIVIISLGIIWFFNITNIPPSEGHIIVKHSGGQSMLITECADPSYVEDTSDYIIEGELEQVESKWNTERNFIYTYSDFKIEKYIKGSQLEYNNIQIITEGGCVEGICQGGEHSPIMDTGKKRLYLTETNGEFRIHGCGGIKTLESSPLQTGDCIENDDGFDIYNKATTKGLGGGTTGLFYKGTFLKEGYHEVEDYCYNNDPSNPSTNGNHLKEYVCSDGRISFGDYECSCEDGECVLESNTCSQQNGQICTPNEICNGEWLDATDTTRCCSFSCETTQLYDCQDSRSNFNDKINILFVASDYNSVEPFLDIVESIIGIKPVEHDGKDWSFFNLEPYKRNKNLFNIDYLFVKNAQFGLRDSISLVSPITNPQFAIDPILYDFLLNLNVHCNNLQKYDSIVIIKNSIGRSSSIAYFPQNLPKVRVMTLYVPDSEKEKTVLNTLTIFRHEAGHNFGGLMDEYYEEAQKAYKPNAGLIANADSEGCPKWCSGELNQESACYSSYMDYKSCINGLDVQTESDDLLFRRCYENYIEINLIEECNLGKNCEYDSGCYLQSNFGTNGFRPHQNKIMRNSIAFNYGRVNELLIEENIQKIINLKSNPPTSLTIEPQKIEIYDTTGDDVSRTYYYKVFFEIKDNQQLIIFPMDFFKTVIGAARLINGQRDYVLVEKDDLTKTYIALSSYTKTLKEHSDLNLNEEDKFDFIINVKHGYLFDEKSFSISLHDLSLVNKNAH